MGDGVGDGGRRWCWRWMVLEMELEMVLEIEVGDGIGYGVADGLDVYVTVTRHWVLFGCHFGVPGRYRSDYLAPFWHLDVIGGGRFPVTISDRKRGRTSDEVGPLWETIWFPKSVPE